MAQPDQIRPLSDTIKTMIAEAGGSGYEGMKRVAKVIVTRQHLPRWKGKSSDEVVRMPHQFSGYERPDLSAFLARQPEATFAQAGRAWNDAQRELGATGIFADHFLSEPMYDNRATRPGWANTMRVVERHGGQVYLKE